MLAGKTRSDIADQLGVHKSTISREIANNRDPDGVYRGGNAHRRFLKRRQRANQQHCKLRYDTELQQTVVRLMKSHRRLSPEQIAGRLALFNGHKTVINHETIYRWIYTDRPSLKKYLRCRKGKYRRKRGTKKREIEREKTKKRSIDVRPDIVNDRRRIGDWEIDTAKGGERVTGLTVSNERYSGYTRATKCDDLTCKTVEAAVKDQLTPLPRSKRLTISHDNGPEFRRQTELERASRATAYACTPYHSWERGTNENTIGLLREYFPKKMPLATITDADVQKAVNALNHRPRKRHSYLTPHEVFWERTPVAL